MDYVRIISAFAFSSAAALNRLNVPTIAPNSCANSLHARLFLKLKLIDLLQMTVLCYRRLAAGLQDGEQRALLGIGQEPVSLIDLDL